MTPTKVFIHYLNQLKQLLIKIESHDKDLSCERLYFNMFPLLQQAKTMISFSLRCSCPLAGREIVSFSDDDYSFSSVFAELEKTQNYLVSIPDSDFRHMEIAKVSTAAGFADLKFDGEDYFIMYALPNFFFHYSMVYAIARQAGVEIGKANFDGFHKYPLGFTFTDECD
ncbi:MAG: DUF1993 domain-containing protein [Cellvibrio sp.]|uniref:DUF1993 domain-containing protein n=1 Tax=Cellvibrio sp. TaxID=1965322 RepID=UPI0031B32BA2